MHRYFFVALVSAMLIAGCARPEPAKDKPGLSRDFWPQSVAFYDQQRGLIAGKENCVKQCGDSVIALTADGGITWAVVHQSQRSIAHLAVAQGHAWASLSCEAEPPGCQPPLLRSTDGGQTWQEVSRGVLAPSFADPKHGWALPGTGLRSWEWADSDAILTTSDGGESWQPTRSPCPNAGLGTASVHLVSPTEGWAACVGQPGAGQQKKALFRTQDGGETWQMAADLGGGGYHAGIFFRPGGKGWFWQSRGATYSTVDSGKNWTWLERFQPETTEARDVWLVSDTTGYVIQHDNEERYFKLLKTTDGGNSFEVQAKWPIDPK